MEMKVDAKTERVRIWEELLKVARPDSKFSWQFSEFICDYEETRSKRQEIKMLIQELKQRNPDVEAHIFRSVENVNVDTVIAYKKHGKKISFLEEYDHAGPAE